MSHETLRIKTADSSAWRVMPDTETTENYIKKLSFATTVYVLFDSGEAAEWYCGDLVQSSLFAADAVIPKEFLAELN